MVEKADDQNYNEGTIYIVDDDDMVRHSLAFSLGTAGFRVRAFASGDGLLRNIGALGPGCILLDVGLPGKDGVAVLSELRDRGCWFPVVMMTGHGETDVAVRARKLGAADFLEKPFAERDLLELLIPLSEALLARLAEENGRKLGKSAAE